MQERVCIQTQKSLCEEWLREVKGEGTIVCLKDVEHGRVGAHKLLERKKHQTLTATNIPEEVISKRSIFFSAFLLNDQPLQVMMPK